MPSNLPPGVRECDIPGNRPEDGLWEAFTDWAVEQLCNSGLTIEESRRAVIVGIAAVKAEREAIETQIKDRLANEAQARAIEAGDQGPSDQRDDRTDAATESGMYDH